MRIALVGMKELPEPDPDEAPLLAALRGAGFGAQVLHWDSDEANHDPAAFDACVLRATWDYYKRPDQFEAWLRRAAAVSRLCNPLPAVLWNMHKRYLLELEAAGVPIIPTVLLERGSQAKVAQVADERRWNAIVIKPVVSAASWKTRFFTAGQMGEAETFLRQVVAQRDMLMQPFMDEVNAGSEVSIVWIDGKVTHAIRKTPRFDGGDERVAPCPTLDRRHVDFAQSVLAAARQDVSYARIDVVERADGSILLSELELIEPSLHFNYSADALEAMVLAVQRVVGESDLR